MPRVSVVLPVYNCERYLREALESVLNQSFKDFETVVVDDGSGSIIKEYISLAGFTIVTHKENMGICRSLNDGIEKSTGEYIAIQHADDVSLPDRLEKQVRYLDTHPGTGLVAGLIQYVDKKGGKKKDDW